MTRSTIFYVSPEGCDDAAGTSDDPLASMEGARRAVRSAATTQEVRVIFHGGMYPLHETVVFRPEDGRNGGGYVSYEAAEGEKAIFSGGVTIRNWRKLQTTLLTDSSQVLRNLWVADVPSTCGRFTLLFDGDRELPRSRGKGFYPLGEVAPGSMWYARDPYSVPCPPEVWHSVVQPKGVEILIIPFAPWAMNILSVEELDRETGIARLAAPCTYASARPHFGQFTEGSAWLENDLGLITQPGHWALSPEEKKVYLWPFGNEPGENIVAPALVEFIAVEGNVDLDDREDEPVKGLHFEGLTFTHGDRYTVPVGRTGLGVQHDWEQFDQPTAAIRFRGAEECQVRNCAFGSIGGTAVRLDLYCQRNSILGNHIRDIGGTGIFLCGYGPGTKNVNRENRVEDNHISRVGRHYWDSPGIFLWQSASNSVAHNCISHTPYAGIVVSGRIVWDPTGKQECSRTIRWHEIAQALGMDSNEVRSLPEPAWTEREQFLHARQNRIEKNDISHVVETITDGNAIYVSGAGWGNLIKENFIHDVPSPNLTEAIRCDDDQHRTRIEKNVIFNLGGSATGITLKGVNDVIGNLIYSPHSPSPRRMISLEIGPVAGSIICDNIILSANPGDQPVFQKRSYGDGPVPRLADCDASHNLYWNFGDAEWAGLHLETEQKLGVESESCSVDPCFVDVASGTFKLQIQSPLPELGFAVPDVSCAGVRTPPSTPDL